MAHAPLDLVEEQRDQQDQADRQTLHQAHFSLDARMLGAHFRLQRGQGLLQVVDPPGAGAGQFGALTDQRLGALQFGRVALEQTAQLALEGDALILGLLGFGCTIQAEHGGEAVTRVAALGDTEQRQALQFAGAQAECRQFAFDIASQFAAATADQLAAGMGQACQVLSGLEQGELVGAGLTVTAGRSVLLQLIQGAADLAFGLQQQALRVARQLAGSEQIAYVAPDAEFSVQQGQLVIELNERILPRLSVNAEYAALMNTSDDPEVQRYVKEKLSEAQALIKGVHTRCDTLIQMLTLIGREQHGFFCGGEALLPVTMQQLSEKMGVSTSTVSRAAQNKYIQFQGRIIPVRSFFTTAIRPDAAVSSHAVKQRLQSLIRAEDPAAPLSDEALRLALSALGIEVSRRAVAKYRAEMGIPSSSQRKKR